MYVCIHVNLCVYIYVSMYVCMYVCMYHISYGTCEKLAELATKYFFENDLFTAVHKMLAKGHGSFGISACCSLDRELVVIASRGQVRVVRTASARMR